jgi:hypothetical protein
MEIFQRSFYQLAIGGIGHLHVNGFVDMVLYYKTLRVVLGIPAYKYQLYFWNIGGITDFQRIHTGDAMGRSCTYHDWSCLPFKTGVK